MKNKKAKFKGFFERAKEKLDFWYEGATLEFTEDIVLQMEKNKINKSLLAEKLKVKPAYITKLLSGHNNYTLKTMVKVAFVLDCELRTHLQPKNVQGQWIEFLKEEPTVSKTEAETLRAELPPLSAYNKIIPARVTSDLETKNEQFALTP
jgi:transcriptional regulator with XRE-family HTH domain